MQTAINVNPSQISLNADDIRIKDAGGIITANDVEGALQENRLKLNAHIAGTADKHAADKINYSGNVTGVSDVKAAIDRLQTNINNISMTGSQHDALVTAALIDVENENFNTAEKGYLNGRLEKWEQRTKAIENDIQEGKTAELIIDGGIGTLPDTAVNGQVSGVVKGLTASNLVKNSKGNTLDGWVYQYVAIENDYFKIDTSNNFKLAQSFNCIANHKYYLTCRYKHITSDYSIHIALRDDEGLVTYVTIAEINNTFTRFSRILTPTRNANELRIYRGAGTGGYFALNEIMIIDLTATFGAGNEPTAEECDKIFASWFDGTKSTVGAMRLKSVGKNLFDGEISAYMQSGNIYFDGSQLYFKRMSTEKYTGAITKIKTEIGETYIVSWKYISGDKSYSIIILDKDYNLITSRPTTSPVSFTATTEETYILFTGTNADHDGTILRDIQVEKGNQATEYEPYKESVAYITAKDESGNILELRSLPNGTKDEIRVSEGRAIIRTKKKALEANEIVSVSTFPINTDLVSVKIADMITPTDASKGIAVFEGYAETVGTNYDNVGYIGCWYPSTSNNTIRFIFPKGTTLEQARTQLAGTTLTYQLAKEIVTPTTSQEISAGPGDTVMWLPHKKDKGLYTETGFIISDQSLPIKSLISVKKKDLATGQDVDIDLSTCTVAGDGLSFTSSALVEGDSTVCVYEYDDSLGTKPQIVVKYNNNFKAQVNSNTDAIQRNNKAILNMQDRLDLMYADLDFRLTILELSGGGEE